MRFLRMSFCLTALTLILMFQSFSTASGQKPTMCKIQEKSLREVKYRIGSFQRTKTDPEGLSVLGLGVSVKPEQVNADYLVLLARNLNRRFCKEDRLVVGIYDKYEIAVYFNSDFQDSLDAFRGEYVLDRTTGKEYVSFTTVPDYQKNYDSRIKIDLREKPRLCNDQP